MNFILMKILFLALVVFGCEADRNQGLKLQNVMNWPNEENDGNNIKGLIYISSYYLIEEDNSELSLTAPLPPIPKKSGLPPTPKMPLGINTKATAFLPPKSSLPKSPGLGSTMKGLPGSPPFSPNRPVGIPQSTHSPIRYTKNMQFHKAQSIDEVIGYALKQQELAFLTQIPKSKFEAQFGPLDKNQAYQVDNHTFRVVKESKGILLLVAAKSSPLDFLSEREITRFNLSNGLVSSPQSPIAKLRINPVRASAAKKLLGIVKDQDLQLGDLRGFLSNKATRQEILFEKDGFQFEIPLQAIGSGSFGAVYSVKVQTPDGEAFTFALKEQGLLADETENFINEIAASAAMAQHPNAALTYASRLISSKKLASSENPNRAYTVSEELEFDGSQVHSKLNEKEQVQFIQDIFDTMSAAHTGNLVHRDLTIENVMLDANKRGRVIDWGLAKYTDSNDGKRPSLEISGIGLNNPKKNDVVFMGMIALGSRYIPKADGKSFSQVILSHARGRKLNAASLWDDLSYLITNEKEKALLEKVFKFSSVEDIPNASELAKSYLAIRNQL